MGRKKFLEACRVIVKNVLVDQQKPYHLVRAVIAPYNQRTTLLTPGKACERRIDSSRQLVSPPPPHLRAQRTFSDQIVSCGL